MSRTRRTCGIQILPCLRWRWHRCLQARGKQELGTQEKGQQQSGGKPHPSAAFLRPPHWTLPWGLGEEAREKQRVQGLLVDSLSPGTLWALPELAPAGRSPVVSGPHPHHKSPSSWRASHQTGILSPQDRAQPRLQTHELHFCCQQQR